MRILKKIFGPDPVGTEEPGIDKSLVKTSLFKPFKAWEGKNVDGLNKLVLMLEFIFCIFAPIVVAAVAEGHSLFVYFIALMVAILVCVLVNFVVALSGDYRFYKKTGKIFDAPEITENDKENSALNDVEGQNIANNTNIENIE